MSVKIDHKTLWQSYGKFFIIALAIALVGYGAWQYKLHRQAVFVEEASLQYDKMLTALRTKDFTKVEEQFKIIQEKYQATPYASLAALIQARVDVEQNAMDKAIAHLQTAVNVAEQQQGPMGHVARVRLARLLADQKKYDEALNLLTANVKTDGYITLYEEAKGDIYSQKNDLDKARDAYAVALKAVPPGVSANALQLKMTDLKNREE